MNRVKRHVSFLLLFICATTFGDFSNSDKQYLEVKNLLLNPGFEQSYSSWDKFGPAGSSLSIATNPLFIGNGTGAAAFDASANTQYFGSSLVTVPAGLYGANCYGKINFKGGDTNLTFAVVDGSGTTLGSSVLAASANYSEAVTSFPCPTSGTMGIRITASANAAAVYLDDAFIGKDFTPPVTVSAMYETNSNRSIANASTATSGEWLLEDLVYNTHPTSFSVSTSLFTCPVSGKYLVTASVALSNDAGWETGEQIALQLLHNGTYVRLMGRTIAQANQTNPFNTMGSATIQCFAGQTLFIRVYQDSDGAITSDGDPKANWASFTRIGP